MSQNSVIIVAGGVGSRMNQQLPKQFTLIHGTPILIYTIRAFISFDSKIKVVLVLPEDHFGSWEKIKKEFLPNVFVATAAGGSSRFQSVKNGLKLVSKGLVAIHDAVRPLITPEIIAMSFESAAKVGSGIVCVPIKDSIRKIEGNTSKALDRSKYHIVQTPQTFQVVKIKKAFETEEQLFFTDDASVYEFTLKDEISLVMGSYQNIKITTPEDLVLAAIFLENKKP
ncbi:MAG: 2-C-methyl-D-erythritol 4-phosphate cytidylyltransferase [Cyclobacteriaceae bacterium]